MIELNPLLNTLLNILNEKKNHIHNCIIKADFHCNRVYTEEAEEDEY